MIKIGDTLKFDEYLPINYMNSQILRKSLQGKKLITKGIRIERDENITRFKSVLIKENTPVNGIYVGTFYKKLIRSYRRTDDNITNSDLDLFTRRDRYSNNPRRIDDPRKLNKMVLMKVGKKLIGVPIVNIYKCNNYNTFKIL